LGPTVEIEENASIPFLRNTIEGKAGTPAISAAADLLPEITKNNAVLLENARPNPEGSRK
jgi:hypothetical protein